MRLTNSIRYMVVPNAEEAGWTIARAIEELVQLNEWQAYSYDREELIAMLDKAMGGRRLTRILAAVRNVVGNQA